MSTVQSQPPEPPGEEAEEDGPGFTTDFTAARAYAASSPTLQRVRQRIADAQQLAAEQLHELQLLHAKVERLEAGRPADPGPCPTCADLPPYHLPRPVILPDFQIRALCTGEDQPMVQPFDEALLNPASLDLLLGDSLLIESAEGPAMLQYPFAQHTEAEPYLLQPGQFVLGCSRETFHMPDSIAGQFLLKSSRAREGLEHLLAGWIDPGFCGSRLTLELTNARQLHPIPLWPGMKIGQVKFLEMADLPLRSYRVTGRYNGDTTAQESKG